MLVYYVAYHMRLKLAPMLFAQENPLHRCEQREDAVAPSEPSETAKKKASKKKTETGETAMSFASVLEKRSAVCRMVVISKISTKKKPTVVMVRKVGHTQKRAFDLPGVKYS